MLLLLSFVLEVFEGFQKSVKLTNHLALNINDGAIQQYGNICVISNLKLFANCGIEVKYYIL